MLSKQIRRMKLAGLALLLVASTSLQNDKSDARINVTYVAESQQNANILYQPKEEIYIINEKTGRIEKVRREDALLHNDLTYYPEEEVYELDKGTGQIGITKKKDQIFRNDLLYRPDEMIYHLNEETGTIEQIPMRDTLNVPASRPE